MIENRLSRDLRELMDNTPSQVWDAFAGQRIFLTGGTGFVGKWLLHSLLYANACAELDVHITVLSRDPDGFEARHPTFAASPFLSFHRGDIIDFHFPQGRFDGVVHAALSVTPPGADDGDLIRSAQAGASRACQFAAATGARRFLHISSGAVYGHQPGHAGIAESSPWDEVAAANTYTQAKRAAERVMQQPWPFEVVIARLFGFVGPYLDAASGTAAAEFTKVAAQGQDIVVQGSGDAFRSYQYASDMARWLLTLYAMGKTGAAYNVGGSECVSIVDLAHMVATAVSPAAHVNIAGRAHAGLAPTGYLPSLELAESELGLRNIVPLPEAIRRTLDWHSETF